MKVPAWSTKGGICRSILYWLISSIKVWVGAWVGRSGVPHPASYLGFPGCSESGDLLGGSLCSYLPTKGKFLTLEICLLKWRAGKDPRKRRDTTVGRLTEFIKGNAQEAHLGWMQDKVDVLCGYLTGSRELHGVNMGKRHRYKYMNDISCGNDIMCLTRSGWKPVLGTSSYQKAEKVYWFMSECSSVTVSLWGAVSVNSLCYGLHPASGSGSGHAIE